MPSKNPMPPTRWSVKDLNSLSPFNSGFDPSAPTYVYLPNSPPPPTPRRWRVMNKVVCCYANKGLLLKSFIKERKQLTTLFVTLQLLFLKYARARFSCVRIKKK